MKSKHDKNLLETMTNNLTNWKGGFYFNKKDPRVMVPKINPMMGWTINFGNSKAYLVIVGLVAIIAIITLVSRLH